MAVAINIITMLNDFHPSMEYYNFTVHKVCSFKAFIPQIQPTYLVYIEQSYFSLGKIF